MNEQEIMAYYEYHGALGRFKYKSRFFRNWVLQLIAKNSPHPGLAASLHRLRGVNVGEHTYIGPEVVIDEVYPELITIEEYVSIGMRTMIFAHSNPTCSIELKEKFYPRVVKPVVIKKGAWIAPSCIILAGVTVGENSVVGAGSLVTSDVEPYSVVAGHPAKVIKKLKQ